MLVTVGIDVSSMSRSLSARLRDALELLGVARDPEVVLILGGVQSVEVVLDKVQKCTSSELGLRDEYVRDQAGGIPRRSLIRYRGNRRVTCCTAQISAGVEIPITNCINEVEHEPYGLCSY